METSPLVPRLSIGVVSIHWPQLAAFLRHHAPLLRDPSVQTVICGEESMRADCTRLLNELGVTAEFLADPSIVSLSGKRNLLLRAMHAPYALFLDDDSWIEQPDRFLVRIGDQLTGDAWLLFETLYATPDGKMRTAPPQPFAPGRTGSGIEWNQLFPVAPLRRHGGWNEWFGIGSPIVPAGEGFILMRQLFRAGLRQTLVPGVAISHPAAVAGSDARSIEKLRGIRRSQPIALVWLWRQRLISLPEFLLWTVRFAFLPFAAGVVALLRGDLPHARVWLLAPFDFFGELPRAWRDPRLRP